MASAERISSLLLKHLRGELSPPEEIELLQWKGESSENRELFAKLTDEASLQKLLQDYYYFKETAWKKLLEKAPELKRGGVKKKRRWLRPSVIAATLVIIMGAAALVYIARNSGDKKHESPAAAKNDIMPGTNRATLILANGSKIMLDSASNGKIADEKNVQVTKVDSGSVVYNADGQPEKELAGTGWNELVVPKGGQFSLQMPDGTKVWLNAASSLRYPVSFSGNERRVSLKGEAYFEVAKNPSMPFKVMVDDKSEVEVLGTHFNIMSYPDEPAIATTLLEGSVKVTALDSKEEPVVIKPGEQALVSNAGGEVQVRKNVETDDIVAWKNGVTSFNDADIRSIMRKVSRWYDVEVSYTGEVPSTKLVGGIPRTANLSEVLKVLGLYNVHFKLEGKRLIISP
jgi:transmembrane sensor